MNTTKISIRFFDDREVRAVWDEQNATWKFSVVDIIAVLTDQDDYTKSRNYWKYLKAKLKKEKNELVSATTQLKLLARTVNRASDIHAPSGTTPDVNYLPNKHLLRKWRRYGLSVGGDGLL